MARKQSFSEKFWHDKNGKFVAWQKPNILLWVWIVSVVCSLIMTKNSLERDMNFVGGIAILIWAILELILGASYFRRLIGLCVLLLIAVTQFL